MRVRVRVRFTVSERVRGTVNVRVRVTVRVRVMVRARGSDVTPRTDHDFSTGCCEAS